MQKLHLVGVTTDRDGLILSVRRGARSGSYELLLDDAVLAAVEEHRSRRADTDADEGSSDEVEGTPRAESTLSVREIQARLRRGRSAAEVAAAAGVDESWVERFAPPVEAERARVVAKVVALPLHRTRLGPSAAPIGEAVRRHLADRGVSMTPDEQREGWTAHLLDDGRWAVRFSYRYRGKTRTLAYELDEQVGAVTAVDRTSGQMGYLAPDVPRPGGRAAPPASRSAARPSGSATAAPARPTSRPAKERERATAAMRKTAARQAVEAERAVARRAKERARLARSAAAPAPVRVEPDEAKADTPSTRPARSGATTRKPATKRPTPSRVAAAATPASSAAPTKAAKKVAGKVVGTPKAAAEKATPRVAPQQKAAAPARATAKPAATTKPVTKAATKAAATPKAATKKVAATPKAATKKATPKAASTKAPIKQVATPEAATSKVAAAQVVPPATREVSAPPATSETSTAVPSRSPGGPPSRVVPPQTPVERARAQQTASARRPSAAPSPRPGPRTTEPVAAPSIREAPRPRFRPNLVEPAGPDPGPTTASTTPRDPAVSGNGPRPTPAPADRPRRTRPLRAT